METELNETSQESPSTPGLSEEVLRNEMAAIYDATEKTEAKAEKQDIPRREGESNEEHLSRVYDAMMSGDVSKAELQRIRTEVNSDKELKEEARLRGMTIDELVAIKSKESFEQQAKETTKLLEGSNEYKPFVDYVGKNYPDSKPHEVAGNLAKWEQLSRENPVHFISEFLKLRGIDPRQVGQALAQHFSQQPQDEATTRAIRAVDAFMQATPEAERYRGAMHDVLNSGEIQDGDDFQAMIKQAYEMVRERGSRRGRRGRKSMEAGMSEIYDRVAAR